MRRPVRGSRCNEVGLNRQHQFGPGTVSDIFRGYCRCAIARFFGLAKPQMLSVTEFDGPRIFAQLFEGKNWMSVRI